MFTPKAARCQKCGRTAEVAHVIFRQNIGMLVMRRYSVREGSYCKLCIGQLFWPYTIVTFFLGWWGIISFVMTPYILLNNISNYSKSFKLSPPPGTAAAKPKLTNELMDKIDPFAPEIIRRLNMQEPLDQVAADIAIKAKVTPQEIKLFVAEIAKMKQKQK